MNATAFEVPPGLGVVTVTLTDPNDSAGEVAVRLVAVAAVTLALTLPNITVLLPGVGSKLLPVMVTVVLPAVGP